MREREREISARADRRMAKMPDRKTYERKIKNQIQKESQCINELMSQ